jgi:integrase
MPLNFKLNSEQIHDIQKLIESGQFNQFQLKKILSTSKQKIKNIAEIRRVKFKKFGIFKRGDTWHIEFYIFGKQLKRSLGTDLITDAVMSSFNVYREIYAKKMGLSDTMYLSDAIEKYRRRIRENKDRENTFKRIDKILDYWGDTDIRLITVNEVEKWVDHLLKQGLKGSTINRWLAVLSGIFEAAKKSDPENKYKIIKSTDFVQRFKEEPRDRVFDIPTAMKILGIAFEFHKKANIKDPTQKNFFWMYPFLIIAGYTGRRPGEIMRLKWSDVDLINRVMILRNTKSKGKDEKIVISTNLRDFIVDLPHKNEYVIGTDIRKNSCFKYVWNRIRVVAGLEQGDVMYLFRHTFVTYQLQEGNINPAVVAKIIGDNPTTMLKHYEQIHLPHVENPAFDRFLEHAKQGQKS